MGMARRGGMSAFDSIVGALAADHFAGDGPLQEIGTIGGVGVRTVGFVLVPHAPAMGRETFDAGVDHTVGRERERAVRPGSTPR